jgi:hypothetical protein
MDADVCRWKPSRSGKATLVEKPGTGWIAVTGPQVFELTGQLTSLFADAKISSNDLSHPRRLLLNQRIKRNQTK